MQKIIYLLKQVAKKNKTFPFLFFNSKQIRDALIKNKHPATKKEVKKVMQYLIEKNKIIKIKEGKYKLL